jgi:hypothetical protein
MLHQLVLLSLTALVSAIAPFKGFLRIVDFEGRSVDLYDRLPVDYDPIQSFSTSAGEPAQNVCTLLDVGLYVRLTTIALAVALQLNQPNHWRQPMAN